MPDACPVLAALHDLPAAPLRVGYSGGLDSTVLLHALARRGHPDLHALHVDHGLHPEAGRWAEHCRAVADGLGIGITVLRAQVTAGGEGREGDARRARYAAFRAHCPDEAVLALAQHRDDQAETVLLRLLRRAGTQGLGGMRRWHRRRDGLRLWRPLLDLPREALRGYALRHGLAWLDDPMNADPALDRNFLRLQVLPLLAVRWPDAGAALAHSAGVLAAEAGLLASRRAAALARCRSLDPACLRLDRLAAEPAALRQPLLRDWLQALRLPCPPGALLQRLAEGLPAQRADHGYPQLRWQGLHFERYRDLLHVERATPAWRGPALSWDGRRPLHLPRGVLHYHGPPPTTPWGVAPRRGGERLRLPGRPHAHALKDLLQQAGLPPWERRGLPLLWDADGELLAAADLLLDAGFDAWLRERGGGLRWLPDLPTGD
jgi:tRNA(Ile)-lysidine synthase